MEYTSKLKENDVKGIPKIYLISFPRSGQHLLERILSNMFDYYNLQFSYCEFYNSYYKTKVIIFPVPL